MITSEECIAFTSEALSMITSEECIAKSTARIYMQLDGLILIYVERKLGLCRTNDRMDHLMKLMTKPVVTKLRKSFEEKSWANLR
jgi:hypothetical protein